MYCFISVYTLHYILHICAWRLQLGPAWLYTNFVLVPFSEFAMCKEVCKTYIII